MGSGKIRILTEFRQERRRREKTKSGLERFWEIQGNQGDEVNQEEAGGGTNDIMFFTFNRVY
jgi:hypothetical protein